MELELEERGNIHTDSVWFEIIDSQVIPGDEGNTLAIMKGLTEKDYKLGCLFTASYDLLKACKKQELLINKLLAIHSLKEVHAYIPSTFIENVRTCAKKAIEKTRCKL